MAEVGHIKRSCATICTPYILYTLPLEVNAWAAEGCKLDRSAEELATRAGAASDWGPAAFCVDTYAGPTQPCAVRTGLVRWVRVPASLAHRIYVPLRHTARPEVTHRRTRGTCTVSVTVRTCISHGLSVTRTNRVPCRVSCHHHRLRSGPPGRTKPAGERSCSCGL